MQQAADESVPVERKLWAESEKESLAIVQEAGVTVTYPDKEPFAAKVTELLDSYKDDVKIYDLISGLLNCLCPVVPQDVFFMHFMISIIG